MACCPQGHRNDAALSLGSGCEGTGHMASMPCDSDAFNRTVTCMDAHLPKPAGKHLPTASVGFITC